MYLTVGVKEEVLKEVTYTSYQTCLLVATTLVQLLGKVVGKLRALGVVVEVTLPHWIIKPLLSFYTATASYTDTE